MIIPKLGASVEVSLCVRWTGCNGVKNAACCAFAHKHYLCHLASMHGKPFSGQPPWMAIAPACGTSTCKASNLTMHDQQNHLPPGTNFARQICSDGAVLPTSVIEPFGFLPKALTNVYHCLSILQGIKYRVSYSFLASLNQYIFKCLAQNNITCSTHESKSCETEV